MRAYIFYFFHSQPLTVYGTSISDAWRNLMAQYGSRVAFAQLKDVQVL